MGMTTLPPNASIGFGPAPIDGQDPNAQDPTQLNAMDPNAQQMPPVTGLPSVGMGGGKSGSLPSGVGIGMPGEIFAPSQDSLAAQSPVPSQIQQPMAASQAPMTQGTGQLPPGFGALSPIDRSQIAPNASMGFMGSAPQGQLTPQQIISQYGGTQPYQSQAIQPQGPGIAARQNSAWTNGAGGLKGRDLSQQTNAVTLNSDNRMAHLSNSGMFAPTSYAPKLNAQNPVQRGAQPAPTTQRQTPVNRFAPPNAPGVRTGITRPRVR